MPKLDSSQVMEILGQVLELDRPARAAFLDKECGSNASLRAEVDRLLKVEDVALAALPGSSFGGSILGRFTDLRNKLVDAARSATELCGKRIGAYEFEDILGQGGMGIVWRGRDTRLDRPVAIKLIPPTMAEDPERLARFLAEARILGSLSHPNVATVYGLEEADGAKFLIMELVEGETLQAKLSRGPLSIPETLSIGIQIGCALAEVHETGVVHRDLKPANIMLTDDEEVKVLDFGLARETPAPMVSGTKPIDQQTTNLLLTRHGSVIGTPRYMSPEQMRGAKVDRRTDVFAFGCVLYECLAGKPAFAGATHADIAAAIIHDDPDWSALPSRTPPDLLRLLQRMIAKDATMRLRDCGDICVELRDIQDAKQWQDATATMPSAAPPDAHGQWSALLRFAAATCLGVGLAAGARLLYQKVITPPPSLPVTAAREQFALQFPNNTPQQNLARLRIGISRDGQHIAVSATDGQHLQIWQRSRGEIGFSAIPGTIGGWIPQFSPDPQWLAFYREGCLLKQRVAGGNPSRIASQMTYAGGYTWGGDGLICFIPVWSKGVARISASGGTPQFITEPDYKDDFAHMSPVLGPDNRTMVFTVWDGRTGTRIDAANIDGTNRHNVVENGQFARFAATPRGPYLLYARLGTIYAAPFDLKKQVRTAPETAIVDGVMTNRPHFAPTYDVADNGTLVYVPGPLFSEESRLVWLEKDLTTTPFNDDRRSFGEVHFTADGSKLSVIIKGEVYWPHIYDLKQGTFNRVVSDSDSESACISPDGNYLAYTTNRDGPYSLWLRDLRTSTDRKLVQGKGDYQLQIGWSPDSKNVVYCTAPDTKSRRDICVANIASGQSHPVLTHPAEQRAPRISPDGKWLAYTSDDSGVREIRMMRFGDASQDHQVTTGGGDWAQWAPDGKSIYYRQSGALYRLTISLENGMPTDRPTLVYDRDFGQSDFDFCDYEIAPDGRILLIEPSERGPKVTQVNVMLNWYAPLMK
jgi:Tol biopolymer transport system component